MFEITPFFLQKKTLFAIILYREFLWKAPLSEFCVENVMVGFSSAFYIPDLGKCAERGPPVLLGWYFFKEMFFQGGDRQGTVVPGDIGPRSLLFKEALYYIDSYHINQLKMKKKNKISYLCFKLNPI